MFGYAQAIRFIFVGVTFYIAMQLVYNKGEKQEEVFVCVNTLFVAALGSGIAIASAPSIGKA